MSSAPSLLQHPTIQSFLVLILIVLVERVLSIPDKYHPLSLLKLMAIRMTSKVNKSTNSHYQQKISGSLAILVITVPSLACLMLLHNFAEFPLFFDAIFLLLALSFSQVQSRITSIANLLAADKKTLAREKLKPLVLRQTEQLSTMGLIKASIETLCLRYSYQYIATLFWFMCLGGIGAFGYRLLFELQQAWNPKQVGFQYFGQPIQKLVRLLSWLPVRLSLLCFMLSHNISSAWQALRLYAPKTSHQLILIICGGALGIQLGGPVIYNQQKYRLPKLGAVRLPVQQDIHRTNRALNTSTLIWLTGCLLISALVFAFLPAGMKIS